MVSNGPKRIAAYAGVPIAIRNTAPVKCGPQGDSSMEKHSHVFERFATFDNMYDGYCLARRNKRYQMVVLDYSANLEENIINDMNRLQWKMYKPEKLHAFYEYFPKMRLIRCASFTPSRLRTAL